VTSVIEVQEGRPNRKVYQITDEGREVLREWLHQSDHFLTFRDPFLIQIFFAGQLSDAEIIQHLEHHLKLHQALLDEYQQLPIPPLEKIRDQRDLSMGRLTLEFGLRFQQMYIDWLKLAIETVWDLGKPAKR
jgi:PadR family transcriptional regulator AphA